MLSEKCDKKLQIHVSERQLADIRKFMEERDMTQSQAGRILMDLGYELYRDLSKLGIVRTVDMFIACRDAIRMLDENPDVIQVVDEAGNPV